MSSEIGYDSKEDFEKNSKPAIETLQDSRFADAKRYVMILSTPDEETGMHYGEVISAGNRNDIINMLATAVLRLPVPMIESLLLAMEEALTSRQFAEKMSTAFAELIANGEPIEEAVKEMHSQLDTPVSEINAELAKEILQEIDNERG